MNSEPPTEGHRLPEAALARQNTSAVDEILAASKRVEHVLHHMAAVVESSEDAIISKDLNGIITSWNRAAERIFGYTEKEALGQSVLMLIPEDHHNEEPDIIRRIRAGERIEHYETVRKRKNGSLVNISLTVSPIKNDLGMVIGASKIVRDVTDRVQADRMLHHMSAVVESSEDAIISKNLSGIITSWNRAAERIFGYTEQEAVGKPVLMLIPEDHHNEEPEIIRRIRAGERIEHYETVRRRKDGSLVDISLTISPIKDNQGTVIGASKIVRDITEKVQAQAVLTESLNREKAAARAKDDFIAMLSHELRAPLNPILLIASDAAQNPQIPDSIREQFELIRKNACLEARLIDDLLDLNRISHGKLQLETQTVEINDLVRSSIQIVHGDIVARQIHLELNLTAHKLIAEADAVRMQQIFWNILSNAIKFTPEGGTITIETALVKNVIQIKIADNGMGMEPKELETVFGAFAQGNHANQPRRYGGLGLGLAITKMLVEAHAGRIEAASNGRHTGSTLPVRIPRTSTPARKSNLFEKASAASASPENAGPPKGLILLVEDHEPTRTSLAILLVRRGYMVVKAASYAEARSLATVEKIDFVVSDIGLPDGNGNDLMAELRDRYGLNGIALTGYGMKEDMKKSNAAGFVTHLTKPVDINALEKALAVLRGR